jgi:alpha-tubulin suppressor-like RCC1 family protein
MISSQKANRGFALPTVLIVSVIMLIVLLSAVSAATTIRSAMDGQYYDQLAREAAESGLARAKGCLADNAYIAQWSNTNPLRPNTSCSGGAACTSPTSCFVYSGEHYRTTFEVSAPQDFNVTQQVSVVGKVELLRTSNGAVRRTYTETISARVGADVGFESVVFGYVGSGGAYFLTIAADGTLKGTGYNAYGQLGNGTSSSTLVPTAFTVPSGLKATDVFASFLSEGRSVFVRDQNGALYGAGYNAYGQLGNGQSGVTQQTTAVPYALPSGKTARYAGILNVATFALTEDNYIYSAGACEYGLLGSSYTISGCSNAATPVRVTLPTPVASTLNTLPTTNIALDRQTAYVRMQGGRVYGWGHNDFGQLATTNTTDQATPIQIGTYGDSGAAKAIQVITDGIAVWILDDKGEVWGAGWNGRGQIANTTNEYLYSLTKLTLPVSAKITKIATDQYSLLALTEDGEVYGAGSNTNGQLGNGTTSDTTLSPTKFILPAGVKAVDIYNTSSGSFDSPYNNSYVIGDNGRVYGTGSNDFGQLGDGTTVDRSTPVAMNVIDGTTIQAQQIQAGFGTAVILTTDQTVYTVGNNGHGQLGDGTTTSSSTPKANRYTNILPVTSF